MRCRKHLFDDTSAVGVCATCLTERLSAVIEAQAMAEAAQLARSRQPDHPQRDQEDRRRSDAEAQPPPPAFPCSLDPYISHRKSDYLRPNPNPNRQRRHHTMSDQLFYFTPQVGPATAAAVVEEGDTCAREQRSNFNFCLLSRLFRFRSRPSNREPSSSNRPSWFSNASFSAARQKDDRHEPSRASVDGGGGWRPSRLRRRCADRGMSPARVSDCGGDGDGEEEGWGRGSDYSPEEWKQTPQRPTATPARSRFGGHSRNVSRLSFCLSPLVRASPGRQWNQKGIVVMPPPEVSFHGGEVRVPAAVVPRLSTGGLNRSRKLADFGRCSYGGHR